MSFEELLQAARAGSDDALGALLESFAPRLLVLAALLTRDARPKLEGSDLVQETFLAAIIHFAEFRGEHSEVMFGWLRQILINRLRQRSRRDRASKRDVARELSLESVAEDLAATPDSANEEPQRNPDQDRVLAALAALPARHRDILVAYYRERRTIAEIAAQTGRSKAAVRKAKSRAVKALRKMMREKG
jgi:RNA polymerase sigma-70 factor (ECF subfamily)